MLQRQMFKYRSCWQAWGLPHAAGSVPETASISNSSDCRDGKDPQDEGKVPADAADNI